RITGGYNFTAQIPLMTERPSRVARIHVRINDEPAGDLELIEKLDRVAMETFKLNQGMILTRTVIRTVTRGIATRQARTRANAAAASSGSGLAQALAFFGGIAATVAVDATERADLRSARYFPGQAYVGEFWVEPGEHTVTVDFYDSAGRLLYRRFFPAGNFTAGGLHLLTAYNLQ
ncbi:MAG: hypothetical protein FWC36_10140, partial [Spirochaetes bacterium]|nr:hypothetical protein [Spirochaetota bacterium]